MTDGDRVAVVNDRLSDVSNRCDPGTRLIRSDDCNGSFPGVRLAEKLHRFAAITWHDGMPQAPAPTAWTPSRRSHRSPTKPWADDDR